MLLDSTKPNQLLTKVCFDFCQSQMYLAAEGRSPRNSQLAKAYWYMGSMQFKVPKVLNWSHLPQEVDVNSFLLDIGDLLRNRETFEFYVTG